MSRRPSLRFIPQTQAQHAGLWLDRFITDFAKPSAENRSSPQSRLVAEVASIAQPADYQRAYDRWERALSDLGAITACATVQGRLAVGLGTDTLIETGISLHRTYGVPIIPGSGLKGLAAAYARQRLSSADWGKDSRHYQTLFGDATSAGYVTFFDALYVPGSGVGGRSLHADVITVHHPDYYQGTKAPADWDSPNPVPFLSATGSFLIALGGPPEWAAAALHILHFALDESGIGAKTSSGYGRMALPLPEAARGAEAVGQPAMVTPAQPTPPATGSAPVLTRGAILVGRRRQSQSTSIFELEFEGVPPTEAIGHLPVAGMSGKDRQRRQFRVRVKDTFDGPNGVTIASVELMRE